MPGLKLPPLSIYIHMPWCVRKCPYCDFASSRAPDSPECFTALSNAICRELELENLLAQERKIVSIYIGGGTPSLFKPALIKQIIDKLNSLYKITSETEISMEANPGTITKESLLGYKDAGINRLSLGIQSLNDKFLQTLHRIHSRDEALTAIANAEEIFNNFNIDLMHSLPGQTKKEALDDLKEAISLNPPHLSWYQLTLEEGTPFGDNPPKGLPDEDTITDIGIEGTEYITEHGYQHYEVSAFTRNKPCRHNTNYWRFGDYLAAGPGAHSKITNETQITRTSRTEDPFLYIKSINQGNNQYIHAERIVNKDELPFEYYLNRLRLFEAFPEEEFSEMTGLDNDVVVPQLKKFQTERLMNIKDGLISLTEKGHLFVNYMLEEFLK